MDNQQRFLMLIQTSLLAQKTEENFSVKRVINAFSEALFIPASALPDDQLTIARMAEEFLYWQFGEKLGYPDREQPDWYLDEWFSDDW